MSPVPARPKARWRLGCAGASAVELALVAPFVLLLLAGTIELGRMYWTLHSLQHAVSESARRAMLDHSLDEAAIAALIRARFEASDPLTITVATTSSGERDFLAIQAAYPFRFVAGVIPLGPVTLSAAGRIPR